MVLLDAGANKYAKNKDGELPWDWAEHNDEVRGCVSALTIASVITCLQELELSIVVVCDVSQIAERLVRPLYPCPLI